MPTFEEHMQVDNKIKINIQINIKKKNISIIISLHSFR